VALLGKNIWGPGPSSFGRQQRLIEITIKPEKKLEGAGQDLGACVPWPQPETTTGRVMSTVATCNVNFTALNK